MKKIKELYEESGYPSAARLFAIAKSKKLDVTLSAIKDYIEKQTVHQLHKRAPAANRTGSNFQASLYYLRF